MPDKPAAPQSVLFLHIPKTGGTTLRSVIARQYPGDSMYEIENPINENLIAFRDMPETKRWSYKGVQGHMSYGLHEYVEQPASYITMLREPVKRAISDYAFVSSNQYHPLYEQVRDLGLSGYMKSGLTGQLENGQTRLVCGDCEPGDTGIPTERPMTQADLDRAIENLERDFAVVGLLERFDESLILMRQHLQWKLPVYVRENVTRKGAKPVVSDEDLAVIREQNRFDIALYEYAWERFDETIRREPGRFAQELASLKRANRRYAVRQQFTWKQLRPRLGQIKRQIMRQ